MSTLHNPADLATLETAASAIQAVTDALPDAGALSTINAATVAIQAVTDALPDAGALTTIDTDTSKIDDAATSGLAGTSNSLAYRVHELERHFHNVERWWGAAAVPDETNAIAATVTVPFVAVSGDNTWGAAIPICGTADNPVLSTDAKFDIHRLLIVSLDDETDAWRIRIIWGTGTSADAITAGQWSEIMLQSNAVPGNRAGGQPLDVIMRRETVGTKLWAQVWNNTNRETMSFYWGAHGYEG